MISKRLRLGLVAAGLALAGCGSVPPLNFSVPNVGPSRTHLDADLRTITVTAGRPDETTGPLPIDQGTLGVWKEALQEAITRMAIFNDDSRRRVSLQVKILKIEIPTAGISFTTNTDARYELVDRSTGSIILSQQISSSGTTPGDFAYLGFARARESVNRAVQNNIALFLQSLETARLDQPLFPAPRPTAEVPAGPAS